jgi:hypothetical protein
MLFPCRSPALPFRWGFRLCLSHLIYTVRSCLIHTCHATAMPFWKRPLKATTQCDMGTAWYVWISIGRPETACGRPACVRLPCTTRSSTKVVTRSRLAVRIFPSTTRTSRRTRHCRRMAGSRHGMCELTRQGNGMETAWYVWNSLYATITESWYRTEVTFWVSKPVHYSGH